MPKVTARQIVITILMVALFAPVYLSSGSADFRPAWFTDLIGPLPVSVWLVIALIVIFVGMTWFVSGGVYGQNDDKNADRGADQ
jgi:hypothetical protein